MGAFGRFVWGLGALIFFAGGPDAFAASPCPPTTTAPMVNVVPSTLDVRYDFTKGFRELGAIHHADGKTKSSPDQATGGLRFDKPEMKMNVSWNVRINNREQSVCLFYDRVDITIALQPIIYVAKEFKSPACRGAVLEHEQKHVQVDRLVMNKYAHRMGVAVRDVVNKMGVLGPYPLSERAQMEEMLSQAVQSVIQVEEKLLSEEMDRLQGQVDTASEYERISRICKDDMAANRPKRR